MLDEPPVSKPMEPPVSNATVARNWALVIGATLGVAYLVNRWKVRKDAKIDALFEEQQKQQTR